jgi:hypothetical protein
MTHSHEVVDVVPKVVVLQTEELELVRETLLKQLETFTVHERDLIDEVVRKLDAVCWEEHKLRLRRQSDSARSA